MENKNQKYVGAPYNFVRLNDKISENNNLVFHNVIDDKLISGTINYTITAKNPLFISNGNKDNIDFYKNNLGNYTIPGSSVRGLIRSNIQILGIGTFGQDIVNNTFMYRDVTGAMPKESVKATELGKQYVNIVGKSNNFKVKAGYIKKKGDDYYLYGNINNKIDDSYTDVSFYKVKKKNVVGLDYYYDEYIEKMDTFVKPIKYNTNNEKNIVERLGPECSFDGYLVKSGYISKKKVLYVIPKIDCNNYQKISRNDIESFETDYENKKNKLKKQNRSYYKLPGNGEIKPIFYLKNNGRIYFGVTPYMRIYYDKDIFHGIPECHFDNNIVDFQKSMFGFINKDNTNVNVKSYKSRLCFCDAELKVNKGFYNRVDILPGMPLASNYKDYLLQDNMNNCNIKSYNSSKFRIRGVKQYWFKGIQYTDKFLNKNNKINGNFKQTIRPIKADSTFCGNIKFNNLNSIELGLLLWSLKLEKGCYLNIGMGKPYGLGKIGFEIDELSIYDYERMYSLSKFSLQPFKNETMSIDDYINKYKVYISKKYGKECLSIESISDFIFMKSSNIPDEMTRYMELNEYKGNRLPLNNLENMKKPTDDLENIKKPSSNSCEVSDEELMKLVNKFNKHRK